MIRVCNLASSIEMTYMPIVIEPRRFDKHKMNDIMPQEVRNNLWAAAVQSHDVVNRKEHFHLQSIPLHQLLDKGQGVESNYLNKHIINTTFYNQTIL